MSEVIEQLLHQRINKIEEIHDYVQIHFANGAILNIFNTFSVSGGELVDLIGSEISGVNTNEIEANLLLSKGGAIHVGMTDADYVGPEAMEFIAANGARVIWS